MPLPRARRLLEDAVAQGVTPGAQLAVRAGDRAFDVCVGALTYEGTDAVTADTRYDLASLTKPLTALAWMRAPVSLDAPVGALLPWMLGAPAERATIEALLTHRASLAAWRPFYRSLHPSEAGSAQARDTVLRAAVETPLEPTDRARYSDLGYMLAGEALRAATGDELSAQIAQTLAPIGLSERLVFRGVGAKWRDAAVAPTEVCPWREGLVQGEVHDDNAYALGGVCGHAGVFGRASDLAALGVAMISALRGSDVGVAPPIARAMLAQRPGGSQRLGWDGKSAEGSSAGTRMGANTFGHLGFTGISLWCDPDAGVVVALVTNRVHPRRDNGLIRALRPALHDAVWEDLRG